VRGRRSAELEFAEFFQGSWDPCVRTVMAVTGRRGDAEDQVAEAFVRAFASWRKVRRHPAPRAWVVRTALNAGASSWRKTRRELPMDPGDHDPAAPADSPFGLDPVIVKALRRLPDRQREVIALRVFLDLDIDSTATLLGIAPGTVRAHLSRAVATLRSQFDVPQTMEEFR
jgi:RNA polymerase sigma factor (sigma-70 family)